MNTEFKPSNLKIKNSKSQNENIFTNKLKNNVKLESLVSEYKYFTPQFYLNNKKNIKNFHNIDVSLKMFNKKYHELKKILEFNKQYLNLPIKNINLDFDSNKNIIYKNLDFKKASDLNYLIDNEKNIFQNVKEYRIQQNIYTSYKSSLFIKILDEKIVKKDKTVFIHLYKNMLKHLKIVIKYDYSMGVLGFSPIFNLNDSKVNELNNNNNSKKYILMTSKVSPNINTPETSNKSLNNKKKKIDDLLINYTNLYNSYNYITIIEQNKKNLQELCIKFYNTSLSLEQKSYTNIYNLLNLLLDQEYYLINFIVNFNNIETSKKVLKQDNIIRKYIKRNILNFSSYMDQYKVKITKSDEIDMFSIQDYDVTSFFKSNK